MECDASAAVTHDDGLLVWRYEHPALASRDEGHLQAQGRFCHKTKTTNSCYAASTPAGSGTS